LSQAVRDLPDPLSPTPALPSSSPDDLLAKMADEAIDQLMADADKGRPTVTPPALEEPAEAPAPEPPESAARVAPEATAAPATLAPAAEQQHGETPAAATDATIPAASDSDPPSPAADVKALLGDIPEDASSPLLWPLQVINAPFAWLGERTRMTLGLIGVVTLVPAICAIVYVVFLKHR
jgi:hypothetical protein